MNSNRCNKIKQLCHIGCAFFFLAAFSVAFATPPLSEERWPEPLEQLALEDLEMVGVIRYQEKNWALISANGILQLASKGHYIGSNHGIISAVYQDHIDIDEYDFNTQQWVSQKNALIFTPGKEARRQTLTQALDVAGSISIVVNTVPAKDLLLVLAELNQANIIISADEISAVSLNAEGVSWDQAFDLIIKMAELQSMEACGFHIVSSTNNMRHIEPALMRLAGDCPQGEPLSFSFNAIKLAELLGLIGEFIDKPLLLKSDKDAEIALHLKQQPWPLLLGFIALLHRLDVELQTSRIILTKSASAL